MQIRPPGTPVTMSPSRAAELIEENTRLRAAIEIAKTVCGRNNCNCPGAAKMRAMWDELAK